jgi:sugar lactone lactonase YvrE
MQYRHVQTIGGKGNTPDRFNATLRGVAVDGHGQLYAAGDSEIKVFDADGHLKRRWPTARPVLSVAVAGDGSIYAGQLRQIEIFDGAGKLLSTWKDDKLLGRVTAIGFTADSVLAGDAADRAIRRFDRSGKFRNNIGKDNRVNGLLIPNGVVDFSVDANDTIYVANPGKHRIERFTLGGELLGLIGKFDGVDPAGFTGCCNPTNLAIRDHIFTTEKAGPRVKAYDVAGKLLAVIATDLFDPNCKNMSIALDARERVFVVDTVRLAILVFEPEKV